MDYQRTEADYAELYGRNVRTIRRWKAKDWPLDDEAQTRLLMAGGKDSPAESTESTAPRPEGTGEVGLAAAIRRLQSAELNAHAAFLAACNSGNEVLTAQRLKQWNQITEQLRKVEESTPDVEQANKNSLPLSDVRKVLTDLFQQLRQDLEALPRRVAKELAGKDEVTIREGIAREVAELIANLYACRYLESEAEDAS